MKKDVFMWKMARNSCLAWAAAAALALAGCQSSGTAADPQLAWNQLQAQVGLYQNQAPFLQQGLMAERMQHLLGTHYEAFLQNLQVAGPLQKQGAVYYITGNRQHDGGNNAAAVALDAQSNKMRIWWLQDGQPRVVQEAGTAFRWPQEVNTLINNAVGAPAQ